MDLSQENQQQTPEQQFNDLAIAHKALNKMFDNQLKENYLLHQQMQRTEMQLEELQPKLAHYDALLKSEEVRRCHEEEIRSAAREACEEPVS